MSKNNKAYTIKQLFTYTGVSKARILVQMIRYAVYKQMGTRFATAQVNDYKMKLDLHTLGLSKVLFVYGTRELPDKSVAHKVIKEGMHIADIGANIGYYTLMESKLVGEAGHIYAFEPDPRNIQLLKENVALNNFDDRVTIYDKAVSNKAERKQFQLGERSNVSSFVDRPNVVGGVDVDCISLENFKHIDTIDMLRMDAEGYECKIIEGVLPFLRENTKPFKIMLEVHAKEYNDTDLNFKQNLQDLFQEGFRVEYLISSASQRAIFKSKGYTPQETWTETRYTRDIYQNITNTDAIYFLNEGTMRAILLSRD